MADDIKDPREQAEASAPDTLTQVVQSAPVQGVINAVKQATDFGGNLDRYGETVKSAMAGDPSAQQALAQHSLGIAAGTLKTPEPAAMPMDEAARMARAKEMGFDPDKTWYHGTADSGWVNKDNAQLKTNPEGANRFLNGVYLTNSPAAASQYSQMSNGSSVLPVHSQAEGFINLEEPGAFDSMYKLLGIKKATPDSYMANRIKYSPEVGGTELLAKSYAEHHGVPLEDAYALLPKALDKKGIKGFDIPSYQIRNVFNPKEIRSSFAEFDPTKAKKGGLSFADGGQVPQNTMSAVPNPNVDEAVAAAQAGLPNTDDAIAKAMSPASAPSLTLGAPPQAPAAQDHTPVNVFDPSGTLVSIPKSSLGAALQQGFKEASEDDVHSHFNEEKYGGIGQQVITGLEGAANAATFGLSTGVERALGVDPEGIQGRREANPGSHMLGQAAGLVGSAFIPGVGAANLLGKAGAVGAEAVGLGVAETALAKIGSGAVKATIENALFQSGDEVAKMLSSDPNQSVQTAVADIGLSGLIGGVTGGALGSVSPLWKAAMGSKTGEMLQGLVKKAGGIEGAPTTAMDKVIDQLGIDIAPEMRAALSDDVNLQQMAKTLEQSDTTKSGLAYQESLKNFKDQLSDSIGRTFGKDIDQVSGEVSKYEAGKTLGKTLAEEFDSQVGPLSKEYDDLAGQYKHLELDPAKGVKGPEIEKAQDKALTDLTRRQKALQSAMKSGDPEKAIQAAAEIQDIQGQIDSLISKAKAPGTTDKILDRIAKLAGSEGWSASPSSEIMREVGRIQKEVPNLKTLKDLTNYIKAVGDNMQSDPLNGPLKRAGGMIKSIMREAESDLIGTQIGSEAGIESLERYNAVRKAYRDQSVLKDALDDRLRLRGSTSGYGKALREMAQTDGEGLLRRLSGAKDADLLQVLTKSFPKTAEALRNYHVDELLNSAVSKAKAGDKINANALIKSLGQMSPELRQFAVPAQIQAKLEGVATVLEQMNKTPHNFSNTARTVDKLMEHIPASGAGMAALLLGHNPAAAAMVGYATKVLGRDVPDAARLSLLKFMGSTKGVDAAGFKSMVDYIAATAKGANLLGKGSANVFKAGREVLPQSLMPTEADRNRLDKRLKEIQKDPTHLQDVGGKATHYMDDHAPAMSQTAANASNYLNGLRPSEDRQSPLDAKPVINPVQKANYNRALDIAQQPLSVLSKIKAGTLVPQDVTALKAMYPALYSKMQQQLSTELNNAVAKETPVPYNTRMSLSLFLGQPLDSTMQPQAIMDTQSIFHNSPQAQGTDGQPTNAGGRSLKSLNKLPASYQTPQQASEQRKMKN